MKRIKIQSIVKVLIFFLIYRSVATDRQGIFTTSYWDKYIYGIICCCVLFIAYTARNNMKFVLPKVEKRLFYLLFTPIAVAWIYSLFLQLVNPVDYSGFLSRSFSNVMFPLLALLQGLMMYLYFGLKAIDLTFWAYISSFFTSVLIACMQGGLSQFILMIFDSTYNGSVLEMSELTPAICLFIIYYLYKYRYRGLSKKKLLIRELLCIFALVIGMKRILILSILIIIALFIFLNKKTGKIKFWTGAISVFMILIIYVYLYGIISGGLFEIFDRFNINTMARTQLWIAIRNECTFSPLYLGRGLGYTTKWMDNNWDTTGILGLTGTTGIHNDLLKNYIDIGFVGFGVYLFTYLKFLTNKIGQLFDNKAALVYFLLMVLQVLCWFTDNVSGFHVFMWPFYMIVFSLLSDVSNIKRGIVSENGLYRKD